MTRPIGSKNKASIRFSKKQSVYFTEAEYERFQNKAHKKGVSFGKYIREATREKYERECEYTC